jgi:SAM-dependent methyltransferase
VAEWTNEAAIQQWGAMPRAALDAMEPHGDFVKRHLLNPVMLRLLGDVRGRRVLDAGCGQSYFSRMLAERGAELTGVEPGEVAEPGLDPALVPDDPHGNAEVYVHLPNFLVLAAERA